MRSTHSHALKTEELTAVVGDNAGAGDHLAEYNGIWQMISVHDARPLFVPSYCGVNFEFIAPMKAPSQIEPKTSPMSLVVERPAFRVTLHQPPTPVHKVESWMTYECAGPSHIDWTFRYQLHEPELFTRGFAGFFFASYIHRPDNKSIYVLSRDVYKSLMWVQYCTTFQGREAAITWEADPYTLEFSSHDHGLYVSRAPIRYYAPLLLGRRDSMALTLMFESSKGVVISHGMGGGGWVEDRSDRNPAWDFFLYTPNPKGNSSGQWRGRIVYQRFTGRDAILMEYQRYQQSLGNVWEIPRYGPTGRRGGRHLF